MSERNVGFSESQRAILRELSLREGLKYGRDFAFRGGSAETAIVWRGKMAERMYARESFETDDDE